MNNYWQVGQELNKTFGDVYIRNLPKSKERLLLIEESFKKVNLKYNIIPAYDGIKFVSENFNFNHGPFHIKFPSSAGFFGNQITNLKIFMDEIEKESSSFIACDDDCFFRDTSFLKKETIETITTNLPKDWDIIIFGGLYYDGNIKNLTEFTYKKCINGSQAAGSHAIAINKKIYKSLFYNILYFRAWGDGLIDLLIRESANVYLLSPGLIFQDRTLFSDINKTQPKDFIISRNI